MCGMHDGSCPHELIACCDAPAMINGLAALLKLMVLKTNSSVVKCTSAAKKDARVAPALQAALLRVFCMCRPQLLHTAHQQLASSSRAVPVPSAGGFGAPI